MTPGTCSGDDLVEAMRASAEPEFAGQLLVVTHPPRASPAGWIDAAAQRLATLPCVVVGGEGWVDTSGSTDQPRSTDRPLGLIDAIAGDGLAEIVDTVTAAPIASAAFALHLRATERRSVADGLVAESALYSTLLAGPEHRAWRSSTPVRVRAEDGSGRVTVERQGAELFITLDRPQVHNALDIAMRDELLEALAVAEADPDLHVVVRGAGPSFCAGGDLDGFGTAPDPATAHLVRLRRSIGAVLARVSARTTVDVHGACFGAGIELASFASRVVAAPDTSIRLPELGMGLIPGAGGTVSIPARVGRHRTAWLALTGRTLDAEAARSSGLVDAIDLL